MLKKAGLDESLPSRFRPVSNFPFPSKVLERIVNRQIVGYLNDFHLFPDVQSAYRRGHLTETALLKVFSDIIDGIADGKIVILSLLDLTAAFDTVDYDILLKRLDLTYGLSGTILNWLRTYVEGGTQAVHMCGVISSTRRVTCGVPQRSVLGPLLFTLYTADIEAIVRSFGLKHHTYADDNQIYSSCHPPESASLKVTIIQAIDAVDQWMASNRLMLNPIKSEFLWCSSPRRVHMIDRSAFLLKDGSVDVSSVVRNLGAFFDVTMSMNDHINKLIRSCFYHLRRIKSIRRSLPTSTAIQLENCFDIARVDYCNSILSGIPKYQQDRIQSVLNAAARLIFGVNRYDHITPLLKDKLHWLRVPQGIDFKQCLLVYKVLHGLSPGYIADYCVNVSSNNRRSSCDQLHTSV